MKFVPMILIASMATSASIAQPDYRLHGAPVTPAKPDPEIARALTTIKPAHIEQTVKTLVGFGTRSTLSSMETDLPAGQGISAAADWIAGQFDAISKQCGGGPE